MPTSEQDEIRRLRCCIVAALERVEVEDCGEAEMILLEARDGRPTPEPSVCAGTGNHEGQSIVHCDECAPARLEYLRGELRGERISMGELVELQGLTEHIDPSDTELLEAAGVPEHADEPSLREEDAKADLLANTNDELIGVVSDALRTLRGRIAADGARTDETLDRACDAWDDFNALGDD